MKKTISILLVLTVLVNFFTFGFLDVKASAVAGVDDALIAVVGSALASAATGTSAYILNNGINPSSQDLGFDLHGFNNYHKNKRKATTTQTGATDGLITYTIENQYPVFAADPSAPSDQVEFANYLANYLNTSAVVGYANTDGTMTARQYEVIKSATVNAYLQYVDSKKALSNNNTNLFAHGASAFGFTFSDPVTGVNVPMSTNFVMTNIQGFTLSRAFTCTRGDGYFSSAEAATAAGATYMKNWGTNSDPKFMCAVDIYSCGQGLYAIYNGKIYYNCKRNPSKAYQDSITLGFVDSDLSNFCSSDGENLSQAGCTSFVGLPCGYYVCNDPNAQSSYPVNVLVDDVTEETGGGVIPIPNNKGEPIIGAAIGAGILNSDSPLSIDDNGEIVGADGLDLSKIESLLKTLADKNVDLTTVESYLLAIKTATESTNLTTSEIEQILTNINTNISNNTTNISTINTAIASVKELETSQLSELEAINENTRTIAEALTAEQVIKGDKKFDIDTPSVITDKFPFSLPFDIYNAYNLLSAEPVAPKFTFPLKMDGVFDYTLTVDLSEYEWIAVIVRWLLFILFVVGLIIVTNKLIGRG